MVGNQRKDLKNVQPNLSNRILKYYLGKYKIQYIIGVTILVIVNLAIMEIPQATGNITDGISSGTLDMAGVGELISGLVMMIMTVFLGRIGWRYFLVITSRKIEKDIRASLFEKWVRLDITYFNEHKTGNLMAYAINDLIVV